MLGAELSMGNGLKGTIDELVREIGDMKAKNDELNMEKM